MSIHKLRITKRTLFQIQQSDITLYSKALTYQKNPVIESDSSDEANEAEKLIKEASEKYSRAELFDKLNKYGRK